MLVKLHFPRLRLFRISVQLATEIVLCVCVCVCGGVCVCVCVCVGVYMGGSKFVDTFPSVIIFIFPVSFHFS